VRKVIKPPLKRLLINLLVVVLVLAIGEMSLRLWFPRSHRETPVRIDPHYGWRLDEAVLNDQLPPQPLPNEYRILVLGDSCTAGFGIDDAQGHPDLSRLYPGILKGLLQKEFPGRPITVINAAVAGHTSYQGLLAYRELLERHQAYRPDLVIIAHQGRNDSRPAVKTDREILDIPVAAVESSSIFHHSRLYELLADLIVKYRDQHSRPPPDVGDTYRVPQDEYRQNLEELVSLSLANRSKVAFVLPPLAPQIVDAEGGIQNQYYAVMEQVAREHHLPLVRMDRRRPLSGWSWFPDHIHPSEESHRLMAGEIYRALFVEGSPPDINLRVSP